jgi:hypothetical protein
MNFQRLTEGHQTTRMLLLGIIFLTIPCYCLGAVLLAYAPDDETTPVPGVTRSPLEQQTATARPSITPFFTATFTSSSPLQPTPIQIQLRTPVPTFFFPTVALTLTPTNTTVSTPTDAPTITLPPSPTLAPSETPNDIPPEPTQPEDEATFEVTIEFNNSAPTTESGGIEEATPTQETF